MELDSESGSNLVDPGSDEGPSGDFSKATYAEVDLGVSYRFARGWFANLEFRNHNEYASWSLNHADQDHTAFFFGPSVHYASQHWYLTVAALKQIASIAFTDDQRAQMQGNQLYGDEHTSWDGLRVIAGFPFE